MSAFRLGIDIGGTFTDFCLMDETTGATTIAKVPSTPKHPSAAVIDGLRQFTARHAVRAADIGYFVHGTTIGVNTLLERKGARTGLLVTKGFRDILNLGRSRLPDIFDLLTEKPEPLIPRRYVREIDERMLRNGRALRPLPAEEVRAAVAELVAEGVEALTVTFLHSYADGAHEREAKAIVEAAFPDLYVSISSETWPQIREYERALVSAVNAYVGRKMNLYFRSLGEEVAATGLTARLLSTKSNGGVMTAESARRVPVETLSSGPASGVIGAHYVGRQSGFSKIIPLDMGGTSTEVAVIDTDIRFANEGRVGDFEIAMPAVDVSSIGAGGGSIAWTDVAGVLKVGPQSSGADPGPACYGRGGTLPTITDAYVTLGILDPDRFLGGELVLKPPLAAGALDGLAATLGLGRVETAEAILRVATSNMYSELVPLMARKGVDVSEFALLCYGGAGPTHGFLLAKEVGIQRVLVPMSPGTLCALGSLVADVKSDFIATLHRVLDPADPAPVLAAVRESLRELSRRALDWIDAERINVTERRAALSADMRYLGQSFEVTVDLGGVDFAAPDAVAQLRRVFDRGYAAIYGQADEKAPLEIINLRATAIGVTRKPSLPRIAAAPLAGDAARARPDRTRQVFSEGGTVTAGVYDRANLTWGHRFEGPAIVEQYDTTAFIPPGFRCAVDAYGTIVGELS